MQTRAVGRQSSAGIQDTVHVQLQYHPVPAGGNSGIMGVLPRTWMIQRDVRIEPFAAGQHRPGVISYGVTSYGYDVRVDRRYKVFTNVWGSTVDPKQFDPKSFVDVEGDTCIIPPDSFALAETVEYIEVPLGAVHLRRQVHLSLVRDHRQRHAAGAGVAGADHHRDQQHHPLPAKIYSGEGIVQIVFLKAEETCRTSYADKNGKYQDQRGLTLPFVPGTGNATG